MLEIDCKEVSESAGGQIFRMALLLSSITNTPFKMKNIRIGRKEPGLKPQHFSVLKAVSEICDAKFCGKIGSLEVSFEPGRLKGGGYFFDIGTAGSITLFAQTIIPLLSFAEVESRVKVIGGTHVEWSPTIDYYENVFLKILRNFGLDVQVKVEKFGFYPRGGGVVEFFIRPSKIKRIEITERGKFLGFFGRCVSSRLSDDILEREEKGVKEIFECEIEKIRKDGISEGTAVTLWANFEKTIFGSSCIGKKGKRAEEVGREAANSLKEEIEKNGCLDRYMGDQILVFLAFGGGKVILNEITEHVNSCAKTIEIFLNKRFYFDGTLVRV